jgi:hypothetical protein
LRSIEIATDIVHTPSVPGRLFMITNSAFISAMVIGFAIFGDFDRTFPLLSSISQAETILTMMSKDDPSARRQYEITHYLHLAALEHIKRRDQVQMQRRQQDIHNIFGDPVNQTNGETPSKVTTAAQTPTQIGVDPTLTDKNGAGMYDFAENGDPAPPWQLRLDMTADNQIPILTTSGALAYGGEDDDRMPTISRSDFGQFQDTDRLSSDGSGIPSLPSYADEFPLFSLMTDFDQLQDGFPMIT